LASDSGIDTEGVFENSVAYIKTWIRVLKNEPRMVVLAAAQAQKSTDLILNKPKEEFPD
jgi:antirestriction protein ArdC